MGWERRNSDSEELIGGDRRQDRRYTIQLECRWKLIRRRRVLDTGTGHTLDLSSSGLLFNAGRHLPEGLNVELSVSWPVLLHNVAPLQLIVSGRIVRAQGGIIAVRTMQHEFRTAGITAEQRNAAASPAPARTPPALTSQAVFASLGKMH